MAKVTITFEVPNKPANFVKGTALGTVQNIHEALCVAIHEGDPKAWAYLNEHVEDIQIFGTSYKI